MARLSRIFIDDDTSATLYYEVWYRISGATNWTQQTFTYPLPIYSSVSPAIESAFIGLQPLADGTEYEYKVRRFNPDNQFSDWVEGSFTTGS